MQLSAWSNTSARWNLISWAAIAADGLNLGADPKSVGDVKDLFKYFRDEFLPVIERRMRTSK